MRFLTSDDGEIDSLSVPIESAVENIVFTRKQPVLTQELVEALLGNYQPPIDGMTLTVTARDGRVYVASTGGAPREMKAHKLSEDVISFRLERLRLDFVREGGAVGRLVYKAPGLTLEAPRN